MTDGPQNLTLIIIFSLTIIPICIGLFKINFKTNRSFNAYKAFAIGAITLFTGVSSIYLTKTGQQGSISPKTGLAVGYFLIIASIVVFGICYHILTSESNQRSIQTRSHFNKTNETFSQNSKKKIFLFLLYTATILGGIASTITIIEYIF